MGKRILITTAAIALLLAAPAAAKPKTVHYEGETVGGDPISFAIKGKRLFDIDGYLSSTCVPTHGNPVVFSTEFSPPGSFVLGKIRKAHRTEYMAYKGDVRKNYTISIKKKRGGLWIADLHLNYSYEEVTLVGYGEVRKTFYVCQGDDEFSFVL